MAAAGLARRLTNYCIFWQNAPARSGRAADRLEPVLLECNLVGGVADGILGAIAHRGCHPGQEHLGRLTPPMGES